MLVEVFQTRRRVGALVVVASFGKSLSGDSGAHFLVHFPIGLLTAATTISRGSSTPVSSMLFLRAQLSSQTSPHSRLKSSESCLTVRSAKRAGSSLLTKIKCACTFKKKRDFHKLTVGSLSTGSTKKGRKGQCLHFNLSVRCHVGRVEVGP